MLRAASWIPYTIQVSLGNSCGGLTVVPVAIGRDVSIENQQSSRNRNRHRQRGRSARLGASTMYVGGGKWRGRRQLNDAHQPQLTNRAATRSLHQCKVHKVGCRHSRCPARYHLHSYVPFSSNLKCFWRNKPL